MTQRLSFHHLLNVAQVTSDDIDYLIQTALTLKQSKHPTLNLPRSTILATLFFEPSTRT
jgi:aspartate carbamoyltransferase catalytic subunit